MVRLGLAALGKPRCTFFENQIINQWFDRFSTLNAEPCYSPDCLGSISFCHCVIPYLNQQEQDIVAARLCSHQVGFISTTVFWWVWSIRLNRESFSFPNKWLWLPQVIPENLLNQLLQLRLYLSFIFLIDEFNGQRDEWVFAQRDSVQNTRCNG